MKNLKNIYQSGYRPGEEPTLYEIIREDTEFAKKAIKLAKRNRRLNIIALSLALLSIVLSALRLLLM